MLYSETNLASFSSFDITFSFSKVKQHQVIRFSVYLQFFDDWFINIFLVNPIWKRYFFYFFVPVQKKIEGFFRFIKGYVWLNLPPSLNFQKGKKARLEAITTFPLLWKKEGSFAVIQSRFFFFDTTERKRLADERETKCAVLFWPWLIKSIFCQTKLKNIARMNQSNT